MNDHAVVHRIESEYKEMPGLALTLDQISRFMGIERVQVSLTVDKLIASGFLRRGQNGTLVRKES